MHFVTILSFLALLMPPGGVLAQQFTVAQVATHSADNDCWTAVDGKVYDITQYLPSHPNNSIYSLCGIEGSSLFKGQHPISYLSLFPSVVEKGALVSNAPIDTSDPDWILQVFSTIVVAFFGDENTCGYFMRFLGACP